MKKTQIIIFIILILILGMLWSIKNNNKSLEINETENIRFSDYLKVTFLDIGQGDATFIEFTNGEQMLVDCAIDARILEALGRVMPYYDKTIDYLLITHPDLDHYGGCQEVLERFEIKNIIYNGLKKEHDQMWNEFWSAASREQVEVSEIVSADVWTISSTTLHFLYPDHSMALNKNFLPTKFLVLSSIKSIN